VEKQSLTTARQTLAAIEQQIRDAIATGRTAIRKVGAGLATIRDEELWKASKKEFTEFTDYAYHAFGMEPRNVRAAIDAEHTFQLLERAKLALPLNDSQALELARLKDDNKQPSVWRRVVEECAKHNLGITVLRIRDAVNQEKEIGHKKGVEVDLEDEEELYLSERGEEALARIKALCGKKVAEAILSKRVKLTEDAVRKWAEQDDDIVREIPAYVIDKGWTVRKTLNYLSQLVDGDTEVDELILMARNRGGRFVGTHMDARIVVEIILNTAP
jgi:hypothetical protein